MPQEGAFSTKRGAVTVRDNGTWRCEGPQYHSSRTLPQLLSELSNDIERAQQEGGPLAGFSIVVEGAGPMPWKITATFQHPGYDGEDTILPDTIVAGAAPRNEREVVGTLLHKIAAQYNASRGRFPSHIEWQRFVFEVRLVAKR